MKKALFPLLILLLLGCVHPSPASPLPPTSTPTLALTPSPTPPPALPPSPTPDPIPPELPVRDLAEIAARLGRIPLMPVPTPTPASHYPGEEAAFWLLDHPANRYFTATATLSVLTPNFCVWVEKGVKMDVKVLRSSVERFEKEIYPRFLEAFGPPPASWSDSCIHIFNGAIPGVGGYFSGSDGYPRQVYPYSNEKRILYLNTGVLRPGTDSYLSVLAHELQHLFQWHLDRNEDTWVNEGLSQMAELVTGLSGDGSARAFLQNPDTQLTSWPDNPDDALPNYGASFLFMAYFRERFGDEAFRELARSPLNGPQAFDRILAPYGLSFEDLFADWVASNYLDDPDSGYGYRGLELPEPRLSGVISTIPATMSGTVRQYAADYFKVQTDKPVLLRFSGKSTAVLGPFSPYSGRFMWWSGRGDEGDSTLTRPFSLKGTGKATLRFRAWYDLEKDYDYAYLMVSSDGGKTWRLLCGPHSTSENPIGNNLGCGYTGQSGGWIEEVVDLTPWAGGEILLRFEQITDDAVNHPGFFLDDISIPEIGYYENFEGGYGGWVPDGFVYTDGVVRQGWIIQAIEEGRPPAVKRWKVEGGAPLEIALEPETVLAVSAFAAGTSEPASYTLSFAYAPSGQ